LAKKTQKRWEGELAIEEKTISMGILSRFGSGSKHPPSPNHPIIIRLKSCCPIVDCKNIDNLLFLN